jgi:hypothetical protein
MVELIDFINQEKINKKVNPKKILTYFNKCISNSLIELDIKLEKDENKYNSIVAGLNMIFNIFFIIIFYSNNIKLTIFLVERSILLYTEFIIMSQDKKIIDDICFTPNITDAISFSYKKTIGPLNINKLNVKYNYAYIKDISLIIKNVLIHYYTHKNNIKDIDSYLNTLEIDLYNLFNKLDKNNHTFLIKYINNILQDNPDNPQPNIFNTIDILIKKLNTYFEVNSNDNFQSYVMASIS